MRNLLILLLTVLIVIACAFLPELVMRRNTLPELSTDYQQVAVTSESSSDYAWRMERMSEHYYGDDEHLLKTYISEEEPSEEGSEAHTLFLMELTRLVDAGVVPVNVRELLADSQDYRIRYYYLFDSESVSGFRIAEFVAAAKDWTVNLCMDEESGKLGKVSYGGSRLVVGKTSYPQGFTSWYDVLRSYAAYLGLSTSPIPEKQEETPGDAIRQYYDSCTADRWTAQMAAGGDAWMELRVLRETNKIDIAVYNGGK